MSPEHGPPPVILASSHFISACREAGLVELVAMLTPHDFNPTPASRAPDPARQLERAPWKIANKPNMHQIANWTQLRDRKQARRRA